MCRPGCDVAMDTSGNHKAKTLNGSAVGCRTKNTPFSFIHLPLSNTHTSSSGREQTLNRALSECEFHRIASVAAMEIYMQQNQDTIQHPTYKFCSAHSTSLIGVLWDYYSFA